MFWTIMSTLSFIITFDFVHQPMAEPTIGMYILHCVDRKEIIFIKYIGIIKQIVLSDTD